MGSVVPPVVGSSDPPLDVRIRSLSSPYPVVEIRIAPLSQDTEGKISKMSKRIRESIKDEENARRGQGR